MNRWRTRIGNAADVKKPSTTYGELTDDAEMRDAAAGVYAEAAKHRAGVIAKDLAAKARKKKVARRG
jgi:hypothetical protein